MPFQIKEFNGAEALDVVTSLYSTEGRGIEIRETDLFFVGFKGEEIVGSVRFCVEHQTPMLRTMRIAKSSQRQGYGLMLLKHFESFLARNQIGPTYCIPYSHLQGFYSQIGFELIDPKFGPEFLRQRMLDYQSRIGSVILMSRPTQPEKSLMIKFEQCSYRTQVNRLRELAVLAVKLFPIRVASMQLINHGENTTFKVTAPNGSKFLLRIHRDGYHSLDALKEELRWLKQLSSHGLPVPQPIESLAGKMIEPIKLLGVGVRSCDMFHWIDGRFLSKSISTHDMFKIGVLLATTQQVGQKMTVRHRRYWSSEGLVGADPKFGSIDQLPGLRPDEQMQITATRKRLLGKLKRYEKLYPEKLGLIHADLHFSNLLKTKNGEIAAIDFDDCGYGFHIYDLAIPLIGAEYHLRQHKRFRDYKKLKKALIDGYTTIREVTDDDLRLLQDLIVARKLLMLGWLQSRSDNPKLRDVTAKFVRKTLSYIAKPWL